MSGEASGTKAPGRLATGRGARRRMETRAKLLRAARELVARNGIGETSIQQITETADVGFGSFYNHFDSKDQIVDAVMEEALESFGDAADRLAGKLTDPAEVVAAAVRHVIGRATSEEAWGWFLIRTMLTSADTFGRGLGKRFARDVRLGVESGRFRVEDELMVLSAAGGVVLGIMTGHLHGALAEDAPEQAATLVLRLLGLPVDEARAVARRALPTIDADEPPPKETI